jgi:hypothetical protein
VTLSEYTDTYIHSRVDCDIPLLMTTFGREEETFLSYQINLKSLKSCTFDSILPYAIIINGWKMN